MKVKIGWGLICFFAVVLGSLYVLLLFLHSR